MMKVKSLVAVLAFLMALAGPAWAGPVTLLWDPGTGATSTDVEQSVDQGVTWTFVKNVPHTAPACSGTPVTCTTTHTAPSTGLILFRFVMVNAVGKTIRADGGPWHNEQWLLPAAARNVGSQ